LVTTILSFALSLSSGATPIVRAGLHFGLAIKASESSRGPGSEPVSAISAACEPVHHHHPQ